MRNLIWILFLTPFLATAQANYARLNLTNIKLVVNKGDTLIIQPISIMLVKNKTNKNNILFQSGDLFLNASFEVNPERSRRSSTMNGAIRISADYKLLKAKKKCKRESEYMFFINQDREFTVKEMFVINNGLSPISYTLLYSAELK